jgi:hypothetical protein
LLVTDPHFSKEGRVLDLFLHPTLFEMRAQLSTSLLQLDLGLELASEQYWLSVVVYDDVIEEGSSNPVGSF